VTEAVSATLATLTTARPRRYADSIEGDRVVASR